MRDDVTDVPNDPKDPKRSRKEQAKQARRAAYLRAKEWKANDPKQIALKEAMKQRQRDAYREIKDRRKAAAVEQKSKDKGRRDEITVAKRADRDAVLRKMIRPPTKPKPGPR